MKFGTAIIHTIEMADFEQEILWHTPAIQRFVLGKKVTSWHTSDGRNEIQLEGEDFFRSVVICRCASCSFTGK